MNNFKIYGSKPITTVLVHGGPGAAGEMRQLALELKNEYSIIEPYQTKKTIKYQVEELKDVILKNCEYPVNLIGHSWGAWLCIILASEYPEIAKKLILVSSGGFEEHYAKSIDKNRFQRLSATEQAEVKKLLMILKTNKHIEEKNKAFAKLGNLLSQADSYKLIEKDISSINCQYDIFSKIWNEASTLRKSGKLLSYVEKLNCPVVAIHGSYDTHPAEGVNTPLSNILNDFKFFLLDRCGHIPWLEKYAHCKFHKIIKKEL
jgi:pimeloyl-ACP methyl ester carboxylesterase